VTPWLSRLINRTRALPTKNRMQPTLDDEVLSNHVCKTDSHRLRRLHQHGGQGKLDDRVNLRLLTKECPFRSLER
jgi:hypothetical protein